LGDIFLKVNVIEDNELRFMETSALDASNVEAAFKSILEGAFSPF